MGNLTKHFNIEEFYKDMTIRLIRESHTPKWHIQKDLIVRLEILRELFKVPIRINSGYRTEIENKSVDGKCFSFHKEGKAADIVVEGISPLEVQAFIKKNFDDGGLGCYKTFTHIDVRNSDELIIWGE